jgi:acyl-CoA thioesterase-2
VTSSPVDALVKLLDLQQVEEMTFQGTNPPAGRLRVFGGQVAAQALVAAGRTVDPSRTVHSLHGYFVRAGEESEPITYRVENIRDGRSFSVRRSVAEQQGRTIFFMSASFHRAEKGLDHAEEMPADLPRPDEVPTMEERLQPFPDLLAEWNRMPRAIDVRYLTGAGFAWPGERPMEENQRAWLRVDGTLPDDPLVHACALAFCSDLTLLDAVLSRHGKVWGKGGFIGASLDHALWFHRPFRADEWFLYDCTSPSASGARGLARGRMFTEDGRLIATAVQEGLLRRVGG